MVGVHIGVRPAGGFLVATSPVPDVASRAERPDKGVPGLVSVELDLAPILHV